MVDDKSRESDAQWTPGDVAAILSNPFTAIQFHPYLSQPHETIIDEETWVGANAKLIGELGPVPYLRNLLMILKGEAAVSRDDTTTVLETPQESYSESEASGETNLDSESPAAGHASIDADLLDNYVTEQMLRRLESEPGIVAQSAAAFDRAEDIDDELAEEIEQLEADPEVLHDVIRATRENWEDLDPDAHRLLVHYLLDRVVIGRPETPLHEQVSIYWRVAR